MLISEQGRHNSDGNPSRHCPATIMVRNAEIRFVRFPMFVKSFDDGRQQQEIYRTMLWDVWVAVYSPL